MPGKQKVTNLTSATISINTFLNDSNDLQYLHASDTTHDESFTFSDTDLNDTQVNSLLAKFLSHEIQIFYHRCRLPHLCGESLWHYLHLHPCLEFLKEFYGRRREFLRDNAAVIRSFLLGRLQYHV